MSSLPITNDNSPEFVGIAQLKYITESGSLSAILGSCVGIVLYSEKQKIAGMCHILLAAPGDNRADNPLKYGSLAIPFLLTGMRSRGVQRKDIKAKIVGGADMFTVSSRENSIGTGNISITRNELKRLNIPIIAEDVGGTSGRNVVFSLDDMSLSIRFKDGSHKVI